MIHSGLFSAVIAALSGIQGDSKWWIVFCHGLQREACTRPLALDSGLCRMVE